MSLLNMYLEKKETLIGQSICTTMFITALFPIVKIWKQPKSHWEVNWKRCDMYMYVYRHIHIHVCIIIYVHMSVYFCTVQLLSCVWLFATPWTTARPLDYSSAITGWNIAICDNLDRSWDYQFKGSTSEKDKYCMISHLYGTKTTKLINT